MVCHFEDRLDVSKNRSNEEKNRNSHELISGVYSNSIDTEQVHFRGFEVENFMCEVVHSVAQSVVDVTEELFIVQNCVVSGWCLDHGLRGVPEIGVGQHPSR